MKSKIYRTTYRNYVIAYNPKSGDSRIAPDYDFHFIDHQGWRDNRIGFGKDVDECKKKIDRMIRSSELQIQVAVAISVTILALSLLFYLLYWIA